MHGGWDSSEYGPRVQRLCDVMVLRVMIPMGLFVYQAFSRYYTLLHIIVKLEFRAKFKHVSQ